MKPKKSYINDLFERNHERKIMLIINGVFLAIAIFFLLTKYHPFYAIIMIGALIFNTVMLVWWMKGDEAKIRDTDGCRINLDKNGIECIQVSVNDALEECYIKYKDIKKIIESTKRGECGFFLILKKKNQSVIYQNDRKTDRKSFYVDGTGYDYEDFTNLYWNLIDRLGDDTVMIGTENQKSWAAGSAKSEFLWLVIPYAVVLGFVVLRIVQIIS